MNTGARRHHVTLDVPDGATGGYVPLNPPDWWCAQQTEAMGQAILIGPFHPGITTATRIHFRTKTYHVDGIINRQERDAELVLSCREVFD